jgi:ATP-dependent Clp protease adaptor protein ClpS
MPELEMPDLRTLDRPLEETEEDSGLPQDGDGPWIVILYNDDYHSFDEVVHQLMLATGCGVEKAVRVMLEAHTRGRAIAHTGTESECERAAGILRAIRLQVETDKF